MKKTIEQLFVDAYHNGGVVLQSGPEDAPEKWARTSRRTDPIGHSYYLFELTSEGRRHAEFLLEKRGYKTVARGMAIEDVRWHHPIVPPADLERGWRQIAEHVDVPVHISRTDDRIVVRCPDWDDLLIELERLSEDELAMRGVDSYIWEYLDRTDVRLKLREMTFAEIVLWDRS
jgi:hypothetical protein